MLLNYTKGGISWQEHGVYRNQVENINVGTAEISENLAEVIKKVIGDAAEKGWLKI